LHSLQHPPPDRFRLEKSSPSGNLPLRLGDGKEANMRTRLLVAVAVLGLAVPGIWADDARDIQGTWRPLSGEVGGERVAEETLKTVSLVIQGNQYASSASGQVEKGYLALNPAANPREIDIICVEGPNAGSTIPAIYELQGDMLRLCCALTGDKRPTEFKSQGPAPTLLATYRRARQ
jgi:uncharacterized protein (TIGR03067 family)